jgi:2-keto-3-deoxy-6-phosphogluconate aldolase
MTAEALAELVNRDGKTVRAFLRKNFARKADKHGAKWIITPALAAKVIAHYAELDTEPEAEAPAEAQAS